LITGITGQDGSYLAELLLAKGYRVVGMVRRSSTVTFERIQHIQDDVEIVQGDLHDQSSLMDLIEQYRPDELYNLAAQSFVPTSWNQPVLTGEVTALGVTACWRLSAGQPQGALLSGFASEMFGKVHEVP
jgi:GDPmannose 4,6-dehydratase